MNDNSVKQVLLLIADISGYTEFMVTSNIEIEHSQSIISELINTIIEQVEIPLEISKLEGDAVFLYASKDDTEMPFEEASHIVGKKLIQFFQVFHDRLGNLSSHASCKCGACANIEVLKLKIIVHSGEALFYRIRDFAELSGRDVILIHRLTKNTVEGDEYILMTEPAYADIEFPQAIQVQEGRESYEHLGEIKTLVYYPA